MKENFWHKLPKPIIALAPLSGVTDCAFRELIATIGKPDILYTEFTSCDGLCSRGKEKLLPDLKFTEKQRPIIAQIFGSKPENFYKTALLCQELGFDGIDINTGCPDKNVEKQGAGASLIKNHSLMKEIISATKEGAGQLPISIKTRTGYDKDDLDEWLPVLIESKVVSVTIHCRTRREMSKVPADWSKIRKAVKIAEGSNCLILGNGDVKNLEHGIQLCKETGADGVMFGRAIFGNPWLFHKGEIKKNLSLKVILETLLEHCFLFDEFFQGKKNFSILKKHFVSYVTNFPQASKLRNALVHTECIEDVKKIIKTFQN